MAVTTTKLPNTTIGITYSAITDSSVDWTGITNSTYFYDKDTRLPYYKNSGGTVVSIFEEGGSGGSDTFVTGGTYSGSTIILNRNDGNSVSISGITSGGGNTIYTADDSLTGNRLINLDSNSLTITGGTTNNATPINFEFGGTFPGYTRWDNTGAVQIKANGNTDPLKVYKKVDASNPNFVSKYGGGGHLGADGGIWTVSETYGGTSTRVELGHSTTKHYHGSTEHHRIQLGGTGTGVYFWKNGYSSLGPFVVGGSAVVGTENISLQGDTLVSKKLELSTTTDGMLMPRLTTAQKNAISSPDTNLMVFDTDLNSLQRYDGSNWVSLAGYGILSLTNSAGEPTFYATYALAIAAASAGDTIEQYGDITDSSGVLLTINKSLTINMNGYTYTNSSTGSSDAIQITATDKVKILNGTIKRINGTYATTSNRALSISPNADVELTGTDVINDGGLSLYCTNVSTKIVNGRFVTLNQTLGQVSVQCTATLTGAIFESTAYNNFGGIITNIKATSTTSNVVSGSASEVVHSEFRQTSASGYDGLLITNGAKGYYCKAYSVSTGYPALRFGGSGAEIWYCLGHSTLDNGIEAGTGTPTGIYHCIGVNVSGANKYGGLITSLSDGVYNSTFIGLGGYGAVQNTGTDNTFTKCIFMNKNSSVSNASFYDTSAGTVRVYDCYSEQADSAKPNLRFTSASKVVYLASNKLKGGTGVSIAHASGNSQNTTTDDYGNIILD